MIKFQSFLSGSSGNCTYVTDDSVQLLVDCGAGGRYITECLRRIATSPEALSGIFITHEHRDHIAGAGILSRKFNIPVYATAKTWAAMGDALGKLAPGNMRYTQPEMTLGSLTVRSFPIPHDAAEPVGYSFEKNGEKFTIATDLGEITDSLFQNLLGSQAIIIEANHDIEMLRQSRYPYPLKKRILSRLGHLSNDLCGETCIRLAESGTRAFWLGHLSNENNRPELAYNTVAAALQKADFSVGSGVSLNVLPRYWIH